MDIRELTDRIKKGGPSKYHDANKKRGKLFVRERIVRLLDQDSSFVEDGVFGACEDAELVCDGVVTGFGSMHGHIVGVIANDSTVKAGSWGRLTVEKIIRLQEAAERLKAPIFYLVDSAGARITDQIAMFPGRRGAGRIFFNQVRLSGYVPQMCIIFGPCAAGGAYIPAFCDLTVMVKGNASMYLGSPRMVEMVIGEHVDHETMGGTEVHTTQSGCADLGCESEEVAIDWMRRWMTLWVGRREGVSFKKRNTETSLRALIPETQAEGYDVHGVMDCILDRESFLEVKPRYAPEIVVGLGTLEGRVIGIVANQPKVKGGVLFCESASKAARFVDYCDAYDIPLLFLCDVPGFMIGSAVEKQGIIRHGAQMLASISSATVPKICLIIRKAFGAGLYAMNGPAFEPDCCLALPSAQIAVMGPEPAVNAVHYNHIKDIQDPHVRHRFIEEQKRAYLAGIDVWKLASELVVDQVVDFDDVASELSRRFEMYRQKQNKNPLPKKRGLRPMG